MERNRFMNQGSLSLWYIILVKYRENEVGKNIAEFYFRSIRTFYDVFMLLSETLVIN